MTTLAAIVPLHNKRPHIERALASILNQTAPVDELIVIDDASSDGGMEVVEQFHSAHPELPILTLRRTEPGPGGYAARNLGIETAKSEWMGFLDADDEWAPGFVETVKTAANEFGPNYGVVFGARRIIGRRTEPYLETSHTNVDGVTALDFAAFMQLWRDLGRCPVWTSATAIRKTDLLAAGVFPACRCKRGGDKDTWARVIEITGALAAPNEVATYHDAAVNQVTKMVPQNQSHCMVPTLTGMLDRHPGPTRENIEWLINHEITMSAVRSLGKAQIGSGMLKGYRTARAPFTYLALAALSLTPRPAQKGLGAMKQWLVQRRRGGAGAT